MDLASQCGLLRQCLEVSGRRCFSTSSQDGLNNNCWGAQGGVRALLAMDANFGELAFELETAKEAEARVTRHAREIAAQLSERARKEVRKLPFPK